jgi:phosphoglucomutase
MWLALEKEYFECKPDVSDPNQLVAFGTSGHRGSSLYGTFTGAPIAFRRQQSYKKEHDHQ